MKKLIVVLAVVITAQLGAVGISQVKLCNGIWATITKVSDLTQGCTNTKKMDCRLEALETKIPWCFYKHYTITHAISHTTFYEQIAPCCLTCGIFQKNIYDWRGPALILGGLAYRYRSVIHCKGKQLYQKLMGKNTQETQKKDAA